MSNKLLSKKGFKFFVKDKKKICGSSSNVQLFSTL